MQRKTLNKAITRPRHRTTGLILWLCVCLTFVVPTNPVYSQQQPATKSKETELRRKAAIELIVETADAARTFKDLFYRARIQTRSADLLWLFDEVRARAIFRRAWEAATAYDKAEQEAEDRESGVPSTLPITEARDEVLTKAAARDSKLGEELLRDLLDKKNDETTAEKAQQTRNRTPWRELSAAGQRRLSLANSLLDAGESEAAATTAAPLINEGASADLIAFVLALYMYNPTNAKSLYIRLLERTSADPQADAIDVLLVSAPVVSPTLLVTVDSQGALQFRHVQFRGLIFTPEFLDTRDAQNLFTNVSASILLRTRPGSRAISETVALYVATGRLLQYFERFSPQFLPDLRLLRSTLGNEIEAGRRENLDSQVALISMTPERAGDVLRPQLDQLGRARDAKDQDRVALGIVKKAANALLWDRARGAAMLIVDVDVRRSALSYIAVCQVADLTRAFSDDKELNTDRLAKFVRNADVPPLVTAWGLAQTAIMAKRKGDVDGAAALLDEAVTFAARTPAGTWQRVAAYAAMTRLAVSIDLKRAWDLLPELVRAANALEDFAGDEESIDVEVGKNIPGNEFEPLSLVDNVFQIDGLFSTMAQLDYEKTLTAARSLGKETPRAFASLAIARVMLEKGHRTQDTELRIKS